MAASDNLEFVIKVRGGPAAAADVRGLTKELDHLTTTTGKATVQTRQMGEEARKTRGAFAGAIASTLRYAGAYGALRVAGAAFISGFRFDATMEQNTVAFTHFLGSAQAAHQELSTLFDIAAHTPFEMSDVTTATRRFLAFGFSVQQANEELRIAGDAIAGAGLGAQGMDQLVRALGQIQAKGRLQGDELLQLSELGIIGPQQIAKQMGMTQIAFQKATTAGKISSEEAIRAINAVLVEQFKGSADEQSKTLIGQLSTAKDYGSQAAGALVQPLVNFAKSSVLPRLTKFFQQSGEYLKNGGANAIYSDMGKLVPLIEAGAAGWAAWRLAVIGVAGAQKALALWEVVTALVAVVPLIWAAATGTGTWAAAWVALTAAMDLNPIVLAVAAIIAAVAGVILLYRKWKVFHDAVNATFGVIWKMLKAIGQITAFLAHPLGRGGDKGGVDPGGGGKMGIGGVLGASPLKMLGHALGFMASGGNLRMGGAAIVGEAGPELAENRGGHTRITPLTTPGTRAANRVLQPLYLQVDGRVFAEVMVDVGQTAAARA